MTVVGQGPLLDRWMQKWGWTKIVEEPAAPPREPAPWPPERLKEAEHAVGQGEKFLAGQLAIGLAADQRAAVLSGIFMATATAVALGILAVIAAEKIPDATKHSLCGACFVAAGAFLTAAYLCAKACQPELFYHCGHTPDDYEAELAGNVGQIAMLQGEANDLARCIKHNEGVLHRNAQLLRKGLLAAMLAPAGGLLGYVIGTAHAVALIPAILRCSG